MYRFIFILNLDQIKQLRNCMCNIDAGQDFFCIQYIYANLLLINTVYLQVI